MHTDGKADLLVADSYNIRLLLGDGNGNLNLATNLDHWNINPCGAAVADFDANGQADVAVGGNPILVALGRGGGIFGPLTNYALAGYPGDIRAGDINGDKRIDLVLSSSHYLPNTNSFCVLTNRGDGSFGTARYYAVGRIEKHPSLELGDFNGDGRLDLAVLNAGSGSLSNSVSIWANQGNGVFIETNRYFLGFAPTDITSADFNGDGTTDLIVRGGNLLVPPGGGPVARVLMGTGDGAFILGPPIDVPADSGIAHPTFLQGDFSGEGMPDLVFTSAADNSIAVMLNQTPPILTVTRLAGWHQIEWLGTFGSGYSLEYTTNLSVQGGWLPFPYPPVMLGNRKAVTDWMDREQKFYRLRKPLP